MDVITYALSRKYVDKSIQGITGTLAGKNCTISNVSKTGLVTTITFQWTADNGDVNTTQVQVTDGETPTIVSTPISGGHRITLSTNNPSQDIEVDVLDGAQGAQGISVVSSNVDENNNLTLTLSNGNVIDAGKIKAVTTVDNTLSTTSSNPVENKVITNALNNKVDKETGKGLFSDVEKAKLANIEDGAQVNVLEKLIVNGQEATITDKSVALTLITSAVSNLQNYYLKTETYTKQEIEDLIGSTVGVTIEIVEQLPTEGQANVIYFLPTETEGVYSQYIYSNNSWILIGSTTVDLSNYYTKTQVDTLLNGKQNTLTIDSFPTALSNNPVASGGVYTAIAQMQPQFQFANMPTASASNLGLVYQYTGATGAYTQNMFYRCVYDETLGEYKWVEVLFHATVTVDSAISGTSTNPVQNKVIKEALDTKQDIIQYSAMPSAQDNLGRTVQYVGTNTANYTNGYFYKAVYDSERDIYLWTVIKFSADTLVDSALSTTSENPVQNKVITGAINNIKDVIPQSATSANKLVDSASLGTASTKSYTTNVEPNNHALVESNAVYNAIASSIASVYKPHGDLTCAELTSAILVAGNVGNIYNMTDSGTTTDLFIQGAGKPISTGNTVGIVQTGASTYKFNLMGNMIDLHNYQTKTLETPLTIGGVQKTEVETSLSALNTAKADSATTLAGYGITDTYTKTETDTSISNSDTTVKNYVNGVISNPNLLDNPWFNVNQRGVTSWSTQFELVVDRWRKSSESTDTIQVTDNGIKELNNGSFAFYQVIDNNNVNFSHVKNIYGHNLTLSVMFSDGTIEKGTLLLPSNNYRPTNTITHAFISDTTRILYAQIESYPHGTNIAIGIKAGGYVVKAVKLELGSVSTLAIDTAPNYVQELHKCQAYFERNRWFSWTPLECIVAGEVHMGLSYKFNTEKVTTPIFSFANSNMNGYVFDITANVIIPNSEIVVSNAGSYNNNMIDLQFSHASFVVGHKYYVSVGDNVFDIIAEL